MLQYSLDGLTPNSTHHVIIVGVLAGGTHNSSQAWAGPMDLSVGIMEALL